MKNNRPVLYTRHEVAKMFGVQVITIDRWIKSGEIEAIKIKSRVRISKEAVERAIEENTKKV
jgi:excisionase family DNA binding protein